MSSMKNEFLQHYKRNTLSCIGLPGNIADAYEIESCLKDTKEKQMYLLRSKSDRARFLLKKEMRIYRRELENEYSALAELACPGLPAAVEFFEDGKYAYLLRTYIEGDSLYDKVEYNGNLTERRAAELMISVCDSLSFLHCQSPPVIHRDIKPQNIILTPAGNIVLIDLGTSRRFRDNALHDTVFMGTHATAAPEQYGFGQTDARSDIYALGVTMAFLLTGEFHTDDEALKTVSRPLRSVISKCTALDPKRRYAGADALKAALKRFLKRRTRHMALGMAAGLCAAALAASFLILNAAAVREAAEGVTFTSPLIEKAVRMETGKEDGRPVLREDLDSVRQLLICGKDVMNDLNRYNHFCDVYTLDGNPADSRGDIGSLEDLRKLKNLDTLVLDRQEITDISALAGLPLQTLELSSNRIADISPLRNCSGLKTLYISDNPIADAGAVSSLKDLETLDISFTNIRDISCISGLPIRTFYMFETPVRDYTPLEGMDQLEELGVRFASAQGVGVIGTLKRLKSLIALECGIKSLDELSELTSLEILNLNGNRITDISGAGIFQRLNYLDLCSNPIESLEPLKQLPLLICVNVAYTGVSDLQVLFELSGMQTVRCDKEQERALGEISPGLPFSIDLER